MYASGAASSLTPSQSYPGRRAALTRAEERYEAERHEAERHERALAAAATARAKAAKGGSVRTKQTGQVVVRSRSLPLHQGRLSPKAGTVGETSRVARATISGQRRREIPVRWDSSAVIVGGSVSQPENPARRNTDWAASLRSGDRSQSPQRTHLSPPQVTRRGRSVGTFRGSSATAVSPTKTRLGLAAGQAHQPRAWSPGQDLESRVWSAAAPAVGRPIEPQRTHSSPQRYKRYTRDNHSSTSDVSSRSLGCRHLVPCNSLDFIYSQLA